MKNQAEIIRAFLLANVEKHPQDIVAVCARRFRTTRTTVHRHLSYLVQQKLISKLGTTKAVTYKLRSQHCLTQRLTLNSKLDEFSVWQQHFSPLLADAKPTIYNICEYGFTEMLNNAKDHSRGTWVEVSFEWQGDDIFISIQDNGVGIFSKLQQYFNFKQLRESVLELSKGKVTTDPNHHTGEGVFFSSRAFDHFIIEANGLIFTRDNCENDWFLQSTEVVKKGTRFDMYINSSSKQNLKSLFEAYQNEDTLAFNKTEIIVALSQMGGERFISRSQAKRILRGLDQFEIIIFDFKGVIIVGQGFADEVFRVYQQQRPHVVLKWINANEDVEFMVKRSIRSE